VLLELDPAETSTPLPSQLRSTFLHQARRTSPNPRELTGLVFARYWTDLDYWRRKEKKRARCAEILVPNLIPSTYINGCYVDTEEKSRECLGFFEDLLTADVRGEIYFK
jgi:proteasome lid subunit RPN8/RPN11